MDTAKVEIQIKEQMPVAELNDAQLALVGGGIGETIL